MNSLRLLLENFQSISSGELIFKTGLNFIIGQSNSGKSATFRALKTCLINMSGSQRFIKKDTKQATVTLEYNGNSITWKRTPKESSYIINNEDYVKTGKSNAIEILNEETGFVLDSNGTLMNIEEELQLPFPFDISKSDLFKLYENVFCISDSATILKSAKEQEDNIKRDLSNLEDDLAKNNRKLNELDKFKSEVNLNKLESMKKHLVEKSNRLDVLKDGLDIIETAIKASKVTFSVDTLNIEDLVPLYKDKVTCKKLVKKMKNLHGLQKVLPIFELNISIDLTNYKELCRLKQFLERIEKLGNLLLPSIKIKDRINEYKDLLSLVKICKLIEELEGFKLPEVEISSLLDEYYCKKKFISEIKEIQERIKGMMITLKEKEKLVEEVQEKLKEYKVCPLCHHELN